VRLDGTVESDALSIASERFSDLRARVSYVPGRATFEQIDVAAFGGRVSGRADVALGEPARMAFDLAGREVDVGRLAELGGAAVSFSSRGDVSLQFEGVPRDRGSWSGRGTVRSAPSRGRFPAAIDATFEMVDGRLRVENASVRAAEAEAKLSLALSLDAEPPSGELRFSARTPSLRRTQDGVADLLTALDIAVPQRLRSLDGSAEVEGRAILGTAPTVDFDLRVADGSFSERGFGNAALRASLAGSELRVAHAEVVGEGGHIELSGRFDIRKPAILVLEGRVRDLELEGLDTLLGARLDAGGLLDGEVALDQGPDGLRGTGEVAIRGLRILGEAIGDVEAPVRVHGERIALEGLALNGAGLSANGDVWIDLAAGSVEARVHEGRLVLAELEALKRRGVEVRGEARVSGPIRYSSEGVAGEIEVSGSDLAVGAFGLGVARGRIELRREGADFHVATGEEHGLALEGRVEWTEGAPVAAMLYFDGTEIELAPKGVEAGLWARLGGHLLVEGPVARPELLSARGAIESAEVQLGAIRFSTSEPVPLRLVNGVASLGPTPWESGHSTLEARAEIDIPGGRFSSSLSGVLDLGDLAALWPEVRAAGPVRVDLTYGGPWDAPTLSGTADLRDGRVRWIGFPDALSGADLRVRFEEGGVEVEEFAAVLGGGEIRGTGHAALDGLLLRDYEMDLDVANVRLRYPEGFRGAYAGRLRFAGSPDRATLGGDLTLLRGVYERELEIGLLQGREREYGAGGPLELPLTVFLDVDLHAAGDVWVRNRMLDLECALDLHFGGEARRPEITGRVWLIEGGEIRFRGIEYRIQAGSLDLLELQRINPYIDVRAETDVSDYDIFLHVQGTLDRIEYRLTSEPPLSPQDIVAVLTTGETLGTLSTTDDDFAETYSGDVVGRYFASALTQPVERRLERLLHLEQVRLDPLLLEGAADPTTRVTLGKEIAEDVLVVYSADLNQNESDIYRVQWKATRRLRLSVESGVNGGVGGELRYAKALWFRQPPPDPAGGQPASPADVPDEATEPSAERIERIRIDGPAEGDPIEDLPLAPGNVYSRSAMLEGAQALRRYYARDERLEARITPEALPVGEPGQGVEIVYHVDPGPRVEIVIEGVGGRDRRRLSARLRELWLDTIFEEDLHADAAALILSYYNQRGFYAADVVATEEMVEGVKRVRFLVDLGKPVRVSEVRIEGAEALAEARIGKQMLTRPGKNLVPSVLSEDVGAIRTLYREQGHLEVRIPTPTIRLSADGSTAEVTMRIEEGPRFEIGEVSVPEDLVFPPADLVTWSGMTPGAVFGPSKLVEAESALRVELDRRGYPDARIVGRMVVVDHRVDVAFDIEPGPLKRIGAIEILGNRKTKTQIIEREVGLEPGELISRDTLLKAQHRLYKLGVLRSVRVSLVPMDGADPSLYKVVVHVEDSPPVRVIFGGGYDTERGVQGSFSLSHSNVGGRARRMAIQGGASEIDERIGWVGEEPRLFGRSDLNGLVSVSWSDSEEVSFDERELSAAVRVGQRINDRWAQFVRYNYQSVDLSNVLDATAPIGQRVEELSLGNLGYSILRSTRDDPFVPTRGTYVSSDARVFAPVFLSEASFTRWFLRGSGIRPFANGLQFVSAGTLGLEWTFGDTLIVPINERFFTGGSESMRGFELDTVGPKDPVSGEPTGGQAMLVLNEELRYPIWRSLHGVVFVDAGNVFLRVKDIDLGDLRYDVGLGFRLETPVGPIRLEYGRKIDRQPGESAGELFLSIGNAF
jgi:outer membrane protein assembly complex protein YaeT